MEELIRITDLNKIYDSGAVQVHALKNINLTIERGEFVAIMGHSGSGKSTLMNILGCLDRPSSGTYLLDGIDISQQSNDALSDVRNQKIGFVFQAFNLIPRTSTLKNVELPMIYGRVPGKARVERAKMLLEKVGLGQRLEHMPNELSGGQKQRCAVARAVVNEPAIVFADEPTGALNRANSLEVLDLLGELNRNGISILMVTHDVRSAVRGNRVLYFEDGGIRGELELAPWDPVLSGDEAYVREREAMASAWLASLSW